MALTREIIFFRRDEHPDPPVLLRSLIRLLRPHGNLLFVWRTLREPREWENLIQNGIWEADESESLPSPENPEDIASSYVPGRELGMDIPGSDMSMRVDNAVVKGIPPDVRGDFRPTELGLSIGFHDLLEEVEWDRCRLVARAFLSLRFWGYEVPPAELTFRSLVFRLGEVKAVKRELEVVTGKLEEWAG